MPRREGPAPRRGNSGVKSSCSMPPRYNRLLTSHSKGGSAAVQIRISRRFLFQMAASAGALRLVRAQDMVNQQRASVSLVKGDSRRKNAFEALMAVDDQIRPVLRRKKYVVIK